MAERPTIKLLLVDDHRWVHELVTKALESEPDIEIVGQGSNGIDAIKLAELHKPDVLLIDVVMPLMDGIEASIHIHEHHPTIKIVVLSSFQDDDSVHAMLKSGAVGYLLKDSLKSGLADCIRSTHAGQVVFSPQVSNMLLQPREAKPKVGYGLTRREQEILRLIADGMNNAQIAQALTVSQSTVKFHISNILYKLGVTTRVEAIALAAKHDLF